MFTKLEIILNIISYLDDKKDIFKLIYINRESYDLFQNFEEIDLVYYSFKNMGVNIVPFLNYKILYCKFMNYGLEKQLKKNIGRNIKKINNFFVNLGKLFRMKKYICEFTSDNNIYFFHYEKSYFKAFLTIWYKYKIYYNDYIINLKIKIIHNYPHNYPYLPKEIILYCDDKKNELYLKLENFIDNCVIKKYKNMNIEKNIS